MRKICEVVPVSPFFVICLKCGVQYPASNPDMVKAGSCSGKW
jgi:hypothetical protein